MSSNRYSYNMFPASKNPTDKGNRKSKTYESSGGGGDSTLDRRDSKVSVFLDEPTFSEDPAEWNKEDYKYNIQFLKKYMINQKQYLKQEEERFARNKQLIASMKSAQQTAHDEFVRKKSEIQEKKNEIEEFKSKIRKNVVAISNLRSQFSCEEEVNRDLKVQNSRLTKRRVLQLRKQTEEGISDDIIEEYDLAKELLESEKERKERLVKKDNWYTTEIDTIREVLAKEDNNPKLEDIEVEKISLDEKQDDRTTNNNNAQLLPEISTIRVCTVSPEQFINSTGLFNEKDIERDNGHEYIANLAPVSNTRENLSSTETKVATENVYGPVSYLPAVSHDYVSNTLAATSTYGHVPRPTTSRGVNSASSTSSMFANVPHSPTLVEKNEHLPQPPSGKKDGAFRRFFRRLRKVFK